ncbi:AzlD domain-containing protein [Azospirillum thermophilum]|uniref:AzlD domain-containing protein n=1 Tax=Azospirillum thermophilum TaxID=2202148 RepID=A0A2S2CX22_9PROT|nr:AzlD domain-containing protein [Azospirillum thermophilum]AWK89074.1 AzlD domain-containing protein [Azospirillum thermophilum]
MNDAAAVWGALVASAIVTYLPRALGVALAGRIDPNGLLFRWTACVAYALLSGLVVRMIVLPIGPLQATDLAARLIATATGLAAFALARGSLLWGAATGTLALVLLTALRFPAG